MRHHSLSLLLWLAPATALAHGPAPVALEVLAHDGATPTLLRTNVGLARANGDGTYEYVCPSRWDENELAPATASADGAEVLVHSAGVAYLSRDRGCSFEAVTGDDLYVFAAARAPGGFVLAADEYPEDLDPEVTRLFALRGGALEELEVAMPGALDGLIAVDGGWLAAGHAPMGFIADEGGVRATFETDATRLTPRAAAGDEVWLRRTAGGEVGLVHLEGGAATDAGPSALTVQGPVRVGARWYALFDGELHVHDGAWSSLGAVTWTCLRSEGGRNFACSLEAMRELTPGDGLVPDAEPVFSLAQLGPPGACGDEDAQLACGRDWAHFGGESGWTETRPATRPLDPRRPPATGGCQIARGRAPAWPLLLLALTLPALRRTHA